MSTPSNTPSIITESATFIGIDYHKCYSTAILCVARRMCRIAWQILTQKRRALPRTGEDCLRHSSAKQLL